MHLVRASRAPGRDPAMSRAADAEGERGQVLVLFALVVVVLMGFTAIVLDVGRLRLAEQDLWNALDAGALAGVGVLPDDGATASALAEQFLQENYPGTTPVANRTISFRCLIGSVAGGPRLSDVPGSCDPGPLPASVPLTAWTCNSSICTAVCDPSAGDRCNTIVVEGEVTVPYSFGRVVGINQASTGTVTSAACRGPCGSPPDNPVDIVLIVDRTQSMNGTDTNNARNAAQSVRKMLKPAFQWLGFSMLGPSTASGCATTPASSIGTANAPADLARWVPNGLTGLTWQGKSPHVNQDFTAASSDIDKAITCYTNSSTGTDLRDPIPMAAYELNTYGRAGVKKGIILMTDGQPNASTSTPTGSNYCLQANTSATNAKTTGVEIFTVAFGLDGSNDVTCPDTGGSFQGKKASTLVASMATNSAADLACGDPENADGDNYFCVPKTAGASTDLSKAFQTATAQLIGSSKLIQLP